MKNIKEVLEKAKSLIEKPENWIQGRYSVEGKCMCAMGAVYVAMSRTPQPLDFEAQHVRYQLRKFTPVGLDVEMFNDKSTTTHADVMEVFDKAIEEARKTT